MFHEPVIIPEWNSPLISHLETCLLQTPPKDSWWISSCLFHMIVLTGSVPQCPNYSYRQLMTCLHKACFSMLYLQSHFIKRLLLSSVRFLCLSFVIKINTKSICCLIDPCQNYQGIEPHESLLYVIFLILCSLIEPKEIYLTSWKKSKPAWYSDITYGRHKVSYH